MDILWWEHLIWTEADTRARDDDELWLDEEANSCIEPDGEWAAMDNREHVGDDKRAYPVHGSKNKWEKWFR
jgi:hypothetical protein